jgi:hypothetical protein
MNFNKNMLKFKSTYETQSLKNEKMNWGKKKVKFIYFDDEWKHKHKKTKKVNYDAKPNFKLVLNKLKIMKKIIFNYTYL